jgi:hypothetical protein
MQAFWWALRARDSFFLAWPLLVSAFIILLVAQSDFVGLLTAWFVRLATGAKDPFEAKGPGGRPTGLVIIPSLLRDQEDFSAITITVESCGTNGYPGELVIIASVDGRTEKPELYGELLDWVAKQSYPDNVKVYVGGTETRLGKMMAVEAGVHLMKVLVAEGKHAAFPEIYFSIDGDGTLGPNALERLADRLTTPHPITKQLRRVVAGKVCIRPDLFWQGWTMESLRSFFTVKGQIYRQVAREFVLSNIARFNWKVTPKIGIPGGLYCTWTQLLLLAPGYMGFMKTITFRQVARWWIGLGPPKFSETTAPPCPEALAGASDDTCMAFLASISTWKDGKLCLDAPRTPFHTFGRLIRGYFWERSHDYAPEARVFTYTPPTLKGLWVQRVRWNSSRFECAGRFYRAFLFHWEIGLPVGGHLSLVLTHVFIIGAYYLFLPYYVFGTTNGVMVYLLGYTMQMLSFGFYTSLALLMEREWRKFWPVLLCLPLSPLHCICINSFGCINGVIRDIFFFGNSTKFAPEWTLRKGRTERVAILFRIRRFLALSVRAVVVGDVPFGAFWLGWSETPWTPSGYDGWTTGKKPNAIIPPMSTWFRGRRAR